MPLTHALFGGTPPCSHPSPALAPGDGAASDLWPGLRNWEVLRLLLSNLRWWMEEYRWGRGRALMGEGGQGAGGAGCQGRR